MVDLNTLCVKLCSHFFFIFVHQIKVAKLSSSEMLTPYVAKHGSRLNYRAVRDCQAKHGITTHELYPAHHSWNVTSPFVEFNRFVKKIESKSNGNEFRIIRGHIAIVSNPMKTVSVLEPNHPGGCKENSRQTVVKSSKQKNCIIAVNAGYFDTHTGECKGNVVSNGRIAHDSGGIQNAHFGITSDGKIFNGYISSEELQDGSQNFVQLVGGVIWLLRNGEDFVNNSKFLECEDTEETGNMDQFISVLSARTAVGHDKNGKILIVQVEGKTSVDGVSLLEFRDLLKSFGAVNAINLDGGGSATFVVNGTVVNYPYDDCLGNDFTCERNVSTIFCVHPPECEPSDCNGHGHCENGQCVCNLYWRLPTCDQLTCVENKCSAHGTCTENGCVCEAGFSGENCEKSCEEGWYGQQCMSRCICLNNSTCDSKNGFCRCQPGFYGSNCSLVTEDLVKKITMEHHLVKDDSGEKKKLNIVIIILSIMAAASIASSILLLVYSCSCFCKSRHNCCRAKQKYKNISAFVSDITMSDSSDNENVPMRSENNAR